MSLRMRVFVFTALVAAPAAAADWPQWRGPNSDAISRETGLLKSWPKEGPPLAWTAKGLGHGFSSPAVAAGKIFGMGTRDKKDGVWALTEADGKELWFTGFDDERPANPNVGPGATPAYHNGKVYAVSCRGTLACLDAQTGKLAWKKNFKEDLGGADASGWGYSESVLVDGDKVICSPSSTKAAVAALKADTGEVIWKAQVPGPVGGGYGYSTPVKATVNGVPMYIALLGDKAGLVGVNADTGKFLWQYTGTAATGRTAQIPTPIVKGDKVWVSCSYGGGAALLQLVPNGDKFDAKVIKEYSKPQLNNHHGGMVLVGDHIYFGHDQNQGYPVCVDFKTGEIAWGPVKNNKEVEGGSGSAAVVYADGRLYFRYQNGKLVLIEPDPKELKVVAGFQLPAPNDPKHAQSWAHPVIANGKLYIRDQDVMYCYDIRSNTN